MEELEMKPEELEESICDTYGDGVIHVDQEDNEVEVEFAVAGEPAVYAKHAVRERVGAAEAWEPDEFSALDSTWKFQYAEEA